MKIIPVLKQTFKEFGEDKAPRLAAALAYYTAFSLAPILIIAIAVAGLVFGQEAVRAQVVEQISGLAGAEGAQMVEAMVSAREDTGTNTIAAVVGIGALLFGAGGVFLQLQDAMNTMWEVAPRPDRGVMGIIKDRIFSFAMVLSVGFLLLVTLVISAALSAVEGYVVGLLPQYQLIMQIVSYLISFGVVTLIFALVFKYVPDAEIAWRDVWLGAAATAVLFMVGQLAIGIYLGNTDFTAQFGAAGALLVILLWIYYSAMISFFGAEFTQVYANMHGSRVRAAENAVPVTREARLREGIPVKEDVEEAGRTGKSVEESGRMGKPAGEAGMVPVTGAARLEGYQEGKVPDQEQMIAKRTNPWSKPPALDPNPLRRSSVERPEERSLRAFSAITMLLTGITGGFVMSKLGSKKERKRK
jgi:membrane protein